MGAPQMVLAGLKSGPPLEASVNFSSRSASGTSPSTSDAWSTATTASVTVTASGGTAPYYYSWGAYSGTTAYANSASSATTTFYRDGFAPSASPPGSYNSWSGVMRCIVTDSASNTAYVYVTVDTSHYWPYPTISVYYDPISCAVGSPYTVYWSTTHATSGVDYVITGAVSASGTLSPVGGGSAGGTCDWVGWAYGSFSCSGPGGSPSTTADIIGFNP